MIGVTTNKFTVKLQFSHPHLMTRFGQYRENLNSSLNFEVSDIIQPDIYNDLAEMSNETY